MEDWSKGYNKSEYTYGYYMELCPARIKLAFLNSGLVFPKIGRACELGFGQGLSVNIHAAATLTEWHGTDFNSAQAGFAQEAATVAGSGANLFDDSFYDYLQRDLGGKFDFISLHGIWSWVSEADRAVLVSFIKERLTVGGVLYISYNTTPGWSSFLPVRNLMMDHINLSGNATQMGQRIKSSIEFASGLSEMGPRSLIGSQRVSSELSRMKTQDTRYLAHEFFNHNWKPMSFAEVSKELLGAKVEFACSADYLGHLVGVQLTEKQQKYLSTISDVVLRESVRDHFTEQRFRKDYWVRGKRTLSRTEQLESVHSLKVIVSCVFADLPENIQTPLGEAKLDTPIYEAIFRAAPDQKIVTIGALFNLLGNDEIEFAGVIQALMALAHIGIVHFPQEGDAIKASAPKAAALNKFFLDRTFNGGTVDFLCSPVTGAGHPVSRTEQLIICEQLSREEDIAVIAERVWVRLKKQGRNLLEKGEPLIGDEKNIAAITKIAEAFISHRRAILQRLQII